eukprot:SAG31_NODE_3666_length_4007_cov_11.238741_2_plen_35_part_00
MGYQKLEGVRWRKLQTGDGWSVTFVIEPKRGVKV